MMPLAPALAILAAFLAARDWPQWRGPARDGAADEWRLPSKLPEALRKVWTVEIGEGHSSPVTVDGRVYTFSRQKDAETAAAWDSKDGRKIWQSSYPAPYEMHSAARAHGKGPKSTPLVHAGRLYTLGISGILTSWDLASGKRVWQKDFAGEHRSTSPAFGAAMSPAIFDGMLIAHVGGAGSGALTAFDIATGAVKWKWDGDGPAYSSPVVAAFGGVRQVITFSQKRLAAVSLAKGELLWSLPFTSPYEQNSVTPVVHKDLLIYSGLGNPVTAIRVKQSGGVWTPEKVWENAAVTLYMNSFVRSGDTLFGLSQKNRGQFVAMDSATGKLLWTSEGRQGDNAAMISAGPRVLALLSDASLLVLPANSAAFAVLKKYTVADSPVWAHPAPAANGILVKDLAHLTLWSF